MQFAFAITMPAEFNTGKLRVDEQQRLKALIGSEILPTLEEQLKKKFASVLDPTIISASPSFNDYVESLVGNALDSKIKLKTTNKTSKSKSSTKLLIPTNVLVKGKPLIGKSKSASIKTKLPLSRKDPGVDLLSITNIIRLGLKQKIIDNMGTGSSRSVLNYRTGRFADSAELIKLTQGKQGFISAYYTYMKYPYATFSEGGKQQYPRSRDPKKLISKSIRELVSEAVSKRMRTVLV